MRDEISHIPADILRILEREHIQEKIILSELGDLDLQGKYSDSYILATVNLLIIIHGKSLSNKEYSEEKTEIYNLDDIESLMMVQLVSSGILIAKIHGNEQLVFQYTNTYARSIGRFTKLFMKLKENKSLTDADLEADKLELYCPKCGTRYDDPERKLCQKCFDRRKIFRRVMAYFPKYKGKITWVILFMLLSSALNVVTPYLTGNVFYDHVLKPGNIWYEKVGLFILVLFLFKFFYTFVSVIYGRINAVLSAEIIYDLKTEIFSALQRLSLKFYSTRQTGTLMNHVNGDSNNLQYFFLDGAPYFVVNLVTMIGVFAVMLSMNWLLAILIMLPVPVIVIVLKRIFPWQWTYYSRLFRRNGSMRSLISDSLTGTRVIKAFGKEESEVNRFTRINQAVYDVNVDLGVMTQTVFPLLYFFMGTSSLIIWGYGSYLVVIGQLTFGSLITFTGYVGMLMGPLQFMTQITNWWSNSMNSASRIFEILDAVPDVSERPNAARLPEIKGDVSINHIYFEYDPNVPILKDISFDVKAGEMIGIVGHTGAGKSTLINLITRLYDVKEGSIKIDGVDLRDMNLHDLHSQIGIVLQETYLFMGSIAENIGYGKKDATIEEIIYAAKIANCHDFIMKLPDGYDTIIGSRGARLSGGEKQRIAIARAVLINPKILILDEATASLDVETERLIQEALERLIKGRTTFAIAHRLSTLRNADRLVVIENGTIIEAGTHEELIIKKGVYYGLLQKQNEALRLQGV